MQPGWSNKRKRLSGYSDVIGTNSYAEELWVQQQNTEKAKALYADSRVAAGTHVRNPDGSITEKSPGFLDYLIGSKSIFGQESLAQNARLTSQGVDWVREKVDEFLGEKGNDEFDSVKDVARFAINLVPGMVEGLFNAPKNFNEAITGERVNFDEEGNMLAEREKLTATQQAAAGAVGALDSAGLALGGSGKFIKEIFKKPLEAGLKTAAKSTIAKEAGKTAGRMATEGVEESLSSVAEDLQDDSQLSEDWVSNAGKSFLLGTAAGGIFDVSGRAIGSAKDAAATSRVNKTTGTTPDIRKGIAERISAADDLSQEQKTAYANSLAEIGQTVSPVSDTNMRTQEFNARADEALKQAKQVKTENADTAETTVPSVSPERAARLRRIDNELNQRLSDIESQLNAIKDNTDTTIQRVVANDGTDVTEAAQKFDKEISTRRAQIRDLQLQADGVNLNTGKADIPEAAMISPDTQDGSNAPRAEAEAPAQQTPKIPSYVPADRVDEYLKSADYRRDLEFERMASQTESGDPFDHPDMYENPTSDVADSYIRETVAQHNSPDEYRKSLIDDIWSRNKKGKGVDTGLIPNLPGEGSGYSGRWAMSNNSPFYQEFYAEYGRKPTKKAITEMVDAELRGEETMLSRNSEVSPYEADIYAQIKEAHEGRRAGAEADDVPPSFSNEGPVISDADRIIRDEDTSDTLNGKDTPSTAADPSEYTGDVMGRANAAERVIKLKQEIADLEAERTGQFEMLGGVQTVIDTKLAREKFAELNRQKYEALDWKIRNNLGETVESLQQKKAELEDGVVSDEFVQMREPVETIEAAVALARESDYSDVSSIQRAAVINQLHREAANAKLQRLYTQEKADAFEAVLDEEYKAREAEIKEMPKPKQEEELLTLNEEYNAQRQDSRLRVAEDADEVQAAERALEIADDIDRRIVDRANSILESDPMAFGKVNPEEMIEIESAVDVALTLKKVEADPDSVTTIESEGAVTQAIRNTADVEEASIIIDEDPRLSDQAATVIADQIGAGNLKGQIWDTFFVTNRQALLKLDNGDKIVSIMDGALREMAMSDDTMKVRSIVDKWKLAYKNEAVSDQTIAFLDQGEPISKMSGESDARFKERTKAVNSIRAYLDDAAKRRGLRRNSEVDKDVEALEATRTEENSADIDKQIAELNSKRMVDNYFAHVHTDMGINVESAAEALARLEAGVNEKGNKLTQKQRDMLNRKIEGLDIGTQQIIARQRIYTVGKDGHAIKRKGAEGWSRDIPFVLDVYQRATNRSVYMQPAIDQVKSLTSDLSGRQLTFVEDTINAVAGRKTRSDELLGDKGVKVLRTTRRFSNMALMGASARTIMLQPTAILNNWRLDSSLGGGTKQFIASTLKSIKAANLPIRQSPALQEFLSAGGMQGSWSTSLRTNKGSKFENALFSGIALMDRNLRFAAYDMGKQTYLKNNAKDPKNPTSVEYDAAKRAGVHAATEAQFGLGPLDVPLAQNSEASKAIFQLQQFNMKQAAQEISYILGDKDGSLIKLEKNKDGKVVGGKLTAKGAKNLLKTVAGYSAIFYLYTQMQVGDDENSKNPFGLHFEDLIPFGEQVSAIVEFATTGKVENEVQAVLPPIWTGLFGRGGQDKGVAGHLFNAMIGGEDVDRGDELASMMQSAIRQFMPMGTQLNRSYQGGKAVIDGESQNKSGSTRFLVDNSSGWNIMKGLVAGQYATTEGQEWLRNGMNTIPKDQTIEFDGRNMPVSEFVRNHVQDPDIKAQYIGYYATKQNAQKELSKSGVSTASVVKDIRTRLAAGYISQAQAVYEIQQHNQLLIDLYRPYMQGNKNMPKYVTLDFMEDVLVDENVTPLQVR